MRSHTLKDNKWQHQDKIDKDWQEFLLLLCMSIKIHFLITKPCHGISLGNFTTVYLRKGWPNATGCINEPSIPGVITLCCQTCSANPAPQMLPDVKQIHTHAFTGHVSFGLVPRVYNPNLKRPNSDGWWVELVQKMVVVVKYYSHHHHHHHHHSLHSDKQWAVIICILSPMCDW